MDEVVIKFVQWIDWGKASQSQTKNLDFEEHFQFVERPPSQRLNDEVEQAKEGDEIEKGEDSNEENEERDGL